MSFSPNTSITENNDLFSAYTLSLPPVIDGETLYSWCARYHLLTSNTSSRQTSRQLFSHPSAGMRTDFPVRLDTLVTLTANLLGSASEVIFKQTVFGAFAPFLASDRTARVIESMRCDNEGRITSALGLNTSRIGTPAPLKACRECICEELPVFHSTWWHWEHQLPAVRICKKHGGLLLVLNEQGLVRARHDWLLPHHIKIEEWHENPSVTTNGIMRLNGLVDWSLELTINDCDEYQLYDEEILRDTCHLRALDLGLVAIDGSLRFKDIRSAFHDVHAGLEALPGLSFLQGAQTNSGGFIGILMRKYGGFQHPLKHLFLLSFLFDSPEQFKSAYHVNSSITSKNRREALRQERALVAEKLCELVAVHGISVNQAAQQVGVSV